MSARRAHVIAKNLNLACLVKRHTLGGLDLDVVILTMRPDFSFSEPIAVPGKIEGTVVAYGPTGNLVTDIPHDRLRGVPTGEEVKITCDEHETVGIFTADHQEADCTLMAILGTSGCLELTIVGDSAKAMLGVPLREKIVVTW
jgi:S-adenosylmethionine hydrolase